MTMYSAPAVPRVSKLEPLSDGWWILAWICSDKGRFFYVVDVLKSEIPAPYRMYDPETRCWQIAGISWLLTLRHVLPDLPAKLQEVQAQQRERNQQHEQQRRQEEPRKPTPPAENGVTGAFAALSLQKTAPKELVTQAYRVWARRLHPDLTHGDHLPMARVNTAYEVVMEYLDKVEPLKQQSEQPHSTSSKAGAKGRRRTA